MLFVLLGSAAATALMLLREHEALRATGPGAIAFLIGLGLCAALACGLPGLDARWRRIARDFGEYVAVFSLIAMIGAVASYPAAAASAGMVDPLLLRADRLLRFDWVRLYEVVARHRALQVAGILAYQSIYLMPAVLLGFFAWSGRRRDARAFLLSFWLAAAITLALFRWLPAAGPLAALWKGHIPYMPQSALYQARLIPALQRHSLRVVDVDDLHGLVSAPSFHAACGVLYILFAKCVPKLRAPLVVLSLAMIAATPIEGTHYLIDVIGGIVVALAAYWAATALTAPRARSTVPLAPAERGR